MKFINEEERKEFIAKHGVEIAWLEEDDDEQPSSPPYERSAVSFFSNDEDRKEIVAEYGEEAAQLMSEIDELHSKTEKEKFYTAVHDDSGLPAFMLLFAVTAEAAKPITDDELYSRISVIVKRMALAGFSSDAQAYVSRWGERVLKLYTIVSPKILVDKDDDEEYTREDFFESMVFNFMDDCGLKMFDDAKAETSTVSVMLLEAEIAVNKKDCVQQSCSSC